MKVCLDNVLIAAFATRGLCTDVLRTVLAEHELSLGEVILEECRGILRRRFKLPDDRILTAISVFDEIDIILTPKPASSIAVRNKADRFVLATAITGEADVLVTGDDDLLSVAEQAPILIVNPRAFWELRI